MAGHAQDRATGSTFHGGLEIHTARHQLVNVPVVRIEVLVVVGDVRRHKSGVARDRHGWRSAWCIGSTDRNRRHLQGGHALIIEQHIATRVEALDFVVQSACLNDRHQVRVGMRRVIGPLKPNDNIPIGMLALAVRHLNRVGQCQRFTGFQKIKVLVFYADAPAHATDRGRACVLGSGLGRKLQVGQHLLQRVFGLCLCCVAGLTLLAEAEVAKHGTIRGFEHQAGGARRDGDRRIAFWIIDL